MVAEALSLLGSEFSSLGFGVHAYDQSGQALRFGLVLAVSLLAGPLLMPLWGMLADRGHARRMLVWGDLGAATVTAVAAILAWNGLLSYPLLFLAVVLSMTLQSMCQPAMNVLVPRLVPAATLERVNGLMQLGPAAVLVVGPALAAPLYDVIGLSGLLLIDVSSAALAALLTLVVVPAAVAQVPILVKTPETVSSKPPAIRLAAILRDRPGLLALIGFSGASGLCFGAVSVCITPMALVLHDKAVLGLVLGCAGVGALAGGGAVWWFGDRWLGIRAYLAAEIVAGLALVILAVSVAVPFLALVAFLVMAATSMSIAIETAIFQRQSPVACLGRVLGLSGLIRGTALAVGILGTGALVDCVLEPGLQPGGIFAGSALATWWGLGPGQGYRLAFVLAGLGMVAVTCMWIAIGSWRPLGGQVLNPESIAGAAP